MEMAAYIASRVACIASCEASRQLTRNISTSSARLMGTKHLDWYFNSLRRQEELKQQKVPPPYPAETLHGRKRARAFFDVQFGRDSATAEESPNNEAVPTHRVVFELADDIVPITCQNFLNVSYSKYGDGGKDGDGARL